MKFKDIWVKVPETDMYLAEYHIQTMLTGEVIRNAIRDGSLEQLTVDMLENIKLSVKDNIDQVISEGIDVQQLNKDVHVV